MAELFFALWGHYAISKSSPYYSGYHMYLTGGEILFNITLYAPRRTIDPLASMYRVQRVRRVSTITTGCMYR